MQSIRNKELFHGIDIRYKQCWSYLLWLDEANHAGIQVGSRPFSVFISDEVPFSHFIKATESICQLQPCNPALRDCLCPYSTLELGPAFSFTSQTFFSVLCEIFMQMHIPHQIEQVRGLGSRPGGTRGNRGRF